MEKYSDPYEDSWFKKSDDILIQKRPLGITILAALQIIGTIILIITLFLLPILIDDSINEIFNIPIFQFMIIYIIIMIPISLFIAYGLLKGKEWARFITILFQISSVVTSLIRFNIFGVIIPIYIIYYLYKSHVKSFFKTEKEIRLDVKIFIIIFIVILLIFNSYVAVFSNPIFLYNYSGDKHSENMIGTWQSDSGNITLTLNSDDTCFMVKNGDMYNGTWEYTHQLYWLDLYWDNNQRDTCHLRSNYLGYNCMFDCYGDNILYKKIGSS